jgi:hypothetical protein
MTDLALDATAVVRLASPDGELPRIFKPLWQVPPRSITVAAELAGEEARLRALQHHFDDWRDPDSYVRQLCGEVPDHELIWLAAHPHNLTQVFDNYSRLLPRRWVELLTWGHWVAMYLIPPDLPALRHAFEALLEIEPQLHVDAYHPNRDHVVHQIADACLAAKLYQRANRLTRDFDDLDWACLQPVVPESAHWSRPQREQVTCAGLALAGLTHDVGYIRYVGAVARERLATVFGVAAPPPSIAPWDLMRVFGGTLLERMLARPTAAREDQLKEHRKQHPEKARNITDGIDGIVVDLYQTAWRRDDHGPLSAFVLASVARGLRLEGRTIPELEAVLQIAIAAAFLHELHFNKPEHREAPRSIREARERLKRYRWPSLFRIVDDLQCWFRPKLIASQASGGSDIDLGAEGFAIEGHTLTVRCGPGGRGATESRELEYLRREGGARSVFDALGIGAITCTPQL